MKTRPAILTPPDLLERTRYHITLQLNGGHSCEFQYTDRMMAREHYDQMRALMQICNQAIRHIDFEERLASFNAKAAE